MLKKICLIDSRDTRKNLVMKGKHTKKIEEHF